MVKLYKWDYGAEKRLYAIEQTYRHAIAVLGGACYAATAIAEGDMDEFVGYMKNVPASAKFRGVDVADALEKFCDICLVDPKLIETYIGMTFAEIAAIYR